MRSKSAPPRAVYLTIVAVFGLLLVAIYRSHASAKTDAARLEAHSTRSPVDVTHLLSTGARSMSMPTASPDGCRPRPQFSAAEQQARREYQAFLLEDAKRFAAPMLQWAGWKGPWIENLWLEHWKQRWAAGADMGDRIYIPVLWIDCYFKCDKPRKQEMLKYLTTLKPEYTYMSVYMMDKGMVIAGMQIPPGLDLLLFSACATTRGVRSVPLPLLKKVLKPRGGLPRDVKVNFLGDLTSHRLRQEMATALIAEPGFMIGKAKHEDTFHIIERSNFTLTPRGHGSASWRMYESLQLGSIPIFIWDYDPILPYQELLDWNEISIIVHRKEIKYIPLLVKHFDVERAQRKLAEISSWWDYEFVHQYIIDRMLKEPCFPAPFSVIQDRYGWEQG